MSKSGGAGSNTQKLKERCLEKLIGFQDLEYNYLDKEEGNRETAKPWSSCEQECRRCSKVIGVLLAAVSGVFFTLCSVTVKLVKSLDPLNIMLARATVQFVLILPILALVNLDMKAIRANRFYILIHGLVGSLTVLSIFIGFSRLPVGDAATIIFSSPVLVMIASWLLLGEHCGVYRFFVVIVLLSGVLLVAQPPFLLKLIFTVAQPTFLLNQIFTAPQPPFLLKLIFTVAQPPFLLKLIFTVVQPTFHPSFSN
ncbi:solute carrier family 35 member G1 isoform X2 [Eurytemora carolleeae]|uniref:solute carrier family 35 member G1 isoform X2 n=1 Tax=Eurytemora carolleeae TaxID=1294199 RepID=UPI000C78EDDB|nr:solute carrier family 35 member G1 isoform X2 [Eurytemora carolleeae]|eukprot:XP_023321241.1 solute carrier family 35 member G1-like isoform X2 [Eurytemora affinis]